MHTLNEGGAIWTRPKGEVTDEQHQEFYRHVAHSPEKPWAVMHNKAEGKVEYTSLLYVPGIKPFDLFHPERRARVKLYVKRVFITDEGVELVPPYLRFLHCRTKPFDIGTMLCLLLGLTRIAFKREFLEVGTGFCDRAEGNIPIFLGDVRPEIINMISK